MAQRVSSQVAEVIPAGQTNALGRVSSLVAEVIPAGQTNALARVGSMVIEVMVWYGGGSVPPGYSWHG